MTEDTVANFPKSQDFYFTLHATAQLEHRAGIDIYDFLELFNCIDSGENLNIAWLSQRERPNGCIEYMLRYKHRKLALITKKNKILTIIPKGSTRPPKQARASFAPKVVSEMPITIDTFASIPKALELKLPTELQAMLCNNFRMTQRELEKVFADLDNPYDMETRWLHACIDNKQRTCLFFSSGDSIIQMVTDGNQVLDIIFGNNCKREKLFARSLNERRAQMLAQVNQGLEEHNHPAITLEQLIHLIREAQKIPKQERYHRYKTFPRGVYIFPVKTSTAVVNFYLSFRRGEVNNALPAFKDRPFYSQHDPVFDISDIG